MTDLRELYQELILDHSKKPRNFGPLPGATHSGVGHNPLCGDKLTLALTVKDDVILDAKFEGDGCAISKSSASLLTEAIRGKPLTDAKRLYETVHAMICGESPPQDSIEIGKLKVFGGVSEFPARVKCASLSWRTLDSLLSGKSGVVKTEEGKP